MLVDMRCGTVHGSGSAISGMSGQAGSVARGFLSAVTDASGSVGHHSVSGALDRYHGVWSTPANRLAHNVEALGNNIAGSAVDVSTGDGDATAAAQTAVAPNAGLASRLNGGWTLGAGG